MFSFSGNNIVVMSLQAVHFSLLAIMVPQVLYLLIILTPKFGNSLC